MAIANYLIQNNLYNREFVRRWWNWEEYLEQRSEVRGQKTGGRRQEAGGGRQKPEGPSSPQSGEIFIETDQQRSEVRGQRSEDLSSPQRGEMFIEPKDQSSSSSARQNALHFTEPRINSSEAVGSINMSRLRR